MRKYSKSVIAILVLALSIAVVFIYHKNRYWPSLCGNDSIRAVVDMGSLSTDDELYSSGYEYELLRMFASDMDGSIEVSFSMPGESWVDSLELGTVDIVALPVNYDVADKDSVLISDVVDDFSVWLVRNRHSLREVNSWIGDYNGSALADSLRGRFSDPFEPFGDVKNNVKRSMISPYDDLIMKYSEELGWDWLLLASVIYQESRFRMESRSGKGAEGLMQMIPATSSRYDVDDMFDPEQNIKAGISHIKRLQRMFSSYAKNNVELRKMALAAYNAGEGHILDCINLAKVNQRGYDTWDALCETLPDFQDEAVSQVDTVKCGPFRSAETMNYIRRIYDIYWAFQIIYSPTQPE